MASSPTVWEASLPCCRTHYHQGVFQFSFMSLSTSPGSRDSPKGSSYFEARKVHWYFKFSVTYEKVNPGLRWADSAIIGSSRPHNLHDLPPPASSPKSGLSTGKVKLTWTTPSFTVSIGSTIHPRRRRWYLFNVCVYLPHEIPPYLRPSP